MISAISVPAAQASSLTDFTDERAGLHAVQCLVEDVEIALRNALRCRLVRRPSARSCDLEAVEARAALAFDAADLGAGELPSHVLVSAPGLVVRPSPTAAGSLEATHELTVFRIRRGRRLTTESVDAMVHTVLPAVLPEHRFHTEELGEAGTEDAVRVIVTDDQGESVIVGACGIVPVTAFERAAGARAALASVLALELNLDALLMLRKGIHDVRLLRSSDPPLARQMRDLGRFRAVATATRPAGLPEPLAKPFHARRDQDERVENETEGVTRSNPAA